MSDTLKKFDNYIVTDGPAALVIREYLMPVEGVDGVIFPATYAARKKGDPSEYNIDYENRNDKSGKNIALIDSVGSQANRIEPMFADGEYAKLVPQIIINAGTKAVNLLDAGHRAGDAIARCSELQKQLQDAFKAIIVNENALPLAKIAPTSLVFGVWDSRDTQAKLPRLISSTIRAYNVRKLTRSAAYFPPIDYSSEGLFTEEEKQDAEGKEDNPLSQRGFVNALATGTHGGVIAESGIRRDAVLALSALKLLKADNTENTTKLQRYILGLALLAFTKLPLGYFRQGTILVCDPEKPREFNEVALDGTRIKSIITHESALEYAKVTAMEFGVGQSKSVKFESTKADSDIKTDKKGKTGKKRKGGKQGTSESQEEAVKIPSQADE